MTLHRIFGMLSGLAMLIVMACLGSPASAQQLDAIIKRGKVIIGIDLAVPPF